MNRTEEGPAGRLSGLTDRAIRSGYCLVRDPAAPHDWKLLDAEYGDVVVSAANLTEIEEWLDS
ncbi:hypothetical protein [Nocardia niwae]|uniref:Uncharacterized protein n=1 Tax=Nocardia niwae TaxID=626084 RepID=A0ABV2X4Q7_9NOCA|nr:hypothetical protein [Nocardia niwae]